MPRKSKARPFCVIDAETDPFTPGRVPQPFIWGCYHGDDSSYYEFSNVAALLAHLSEYRLIVYAHNGGGFDYHYMREFMDSDRPVMLINGKLASFYIGDCEFRDSLMLLQNPLRAFQKTEIDYRKLEKNVRAKHMPEIREYLKSDCVNLYNAIARYFNDYGRSLTQASSAMKYWRETYKVPMTPQTAGQSMQFRPYYYGGRVQCFKAGHIKDKFSVVDINSAYPRAMMEKHPIAPDAEMERHLPRAGQLRYCVAKVLAVAYGSLPFRLESGELVFPNDEQPREYTVTGWELEAGWETDTLRVLRVLEVYKFAQLVDFSDYVQTFWQKRQQAKAAGDKAADIFAKLFLNSLYGKFAADPEKYCEYVIASDDTVKHWNDRRYEFCAPWGKRMLYERPLPEDKQYYYNVCTAASITGYVRATLMRGLAACSGVLYCDTDSIAARDVSRLPLGAELGQWKVEMQGTEYAIAGKKLYAFKRAQPDAKGEDWKIACKGGKLKAPDIIKIAKGETVKYTPEVPTYSVFRQQPVFTSRYIKRTALQLAQFGRILPASGN